MASPILFGAARPKPRCLVALLGASKRNVATPAPPKLSLPPTVFTRSSLDKIREHLLPPNETPMAELPPHTLAPAPGKVARDAAILIPFCNIGGIAHILMEVRAAGLRVHASEASFPGGKAEPEDLNLIASALRETQEELAIPSAHVEILGGLAPEYSLGNKSRVWPVIGFVHSGDALDAAEADAIASDPAGKERKKAKAAALGSLSLSTLHPDVGEVAALLPLPLSAIADPSRQATHVFRSDGRRPYWKIRAGDYIQPPFEEEEMKGLEIWGLSGWFLSRLAVQMGWSDTPPESLEPKDD